MDISRCVTAVHQINSVRVTLAKKEIVLHGRSTPLTRGRSATRGRRRETVEKREFARKKRKGEAERNFARCLADQLVSDSRHPLGRKKRCMRSLPSPERNDGSEMVAAFIFINIKLMTTSLTTLLCRLGVPGRFRVRCPRCSAPLWSACARAWQSRARVMSTGGGISF